MFRELVESLPIAVACLDAEGRVDYVNARAISILRAAGLDGDAAITRMLGSFRGAASSTDEGSPRTAITVSTSEGERTFGFQTTSMTAGKRLVAFQDITRFEQAQQERNRLLQLASISEVMPAVLHELKNPLAGIALSLELLIEDAQSAQSEQRDRLHAILSEVRRLSLTIDGLGRFRHEVRSAKHHAIDLAIREAFALLQPLASARGVEAQLAVSDMPLLPFEPAAVRAVVFNLVTNAIHACRAGQRIELSARFDDVARTMHLDIKDTGCGMTPEVRARCTDLFFTTKPRGSGIGLALCAGVAEAVGGAMHIDSQPEQGTTVSLTFPITQRS